MCNTPKTAGQRRIPLLRSSTTPMSRHQPRTTSLKEVKGLSIEDTLTLLEGDLLSNDRVALSIPRLQNGGSALLYLDLVEDGQDENNHRKDSNRWLLLEETEADLLSMLQRERKARKNAESALSFVKEQRKYSLVSSEKRSSSNSSGNSGSTGSSSEESSGDADYNSLLLLQQQQLLSGEATSELQCLRQQLAESKREVHSLFHALQKCNKNRDSLFLTKEVMERRLLHQRTLVERALMRGADVDQQVQALECKLATAAAAEVDLRETICGLSRREAVLTAAKNGLLAQARTNAKDLARTVKRSAALWSSTEAANAEAKAAREEAVAFKKACSRILETMTHLALEEKEEEEEEEEEEDEEEEAAPVAMQWGRLLVCR